MIKSGAEPFFLPGGPHGVLLIHGFTGLPAEMLLMGKYLQQQGFSVLGVRLDGHGTSPEDLAHTNWNNWFDSVCDGYALLRGCCAVISAVGLSMGGLMALHLSVRRTLQRVVCCSAPVFIAAGRGIGQLPPREECQGRYVPKARRRLLDVPPACNATYRRMPLMAVHELLEVIRTVKAELAAVRPPLLIVQSRQDHTVEPRSAKYIYEHVGSAVRDLLWLETSGHLVTLDRERTLVFERAAGFIAGGGRKCE